MSSETVPRFSAVNVRVSALSPPPGEKKLTSGVVNAARVSSLSTLPELPARVCFAAVIFAVAFARRVFPRPEDTTSNMARKATIAPVRRIAHRRVREDSQCFFDRPDLVFRLLNICAGGMSAVSASYRSG